MKEPERPRLQTSQGLRFHCFAASSPSPFYSTASLLLPHSHRFLLQIHPLLLFRLRRRRLRIQALRDPNSTRPKKSKPSRKSPKSESKISGSVLLPRVSLKEPVSEGLKGDGEGLSHDNLIRPIGFVIYDDVALLLHDYMSNGTLAQLLHGLSDQSDDEPDWLRRLSIAIGVAEGLAFFHSVAVIHLEVYAGNILLDANFRPLVAEIEISKLLDPSRGTASISAVAGFFGYIPPGLSPCSK
ncbi:hypothetical protein Droror1_Dr00027923 [Drosera rotundifolia]